LSQISARCRKVMFEVDSMKVCAGSNKRQADVSSNSDQVWRCSHRPLLSVCDESNEGCLLLLLMGKKSLRRFKTKMFHASRIFDFVRQTLPGGYGRGERATLTRARVRRLEEEPHLNPSTQTRSFRSEIQTDITLRDSEPTLRDIHAFLPFQLGRQTLS
jgi:hypothetical protein